MLKKSFFWSASVLALLGATILLATVTPVRAQLADSPWPTFQHDLRRTGQSTLNGPSTSQVQVKWLYRGASRIQTSPTIGSDGTVYIGVGRAPVCAVNAADGTEKWCASDSIGIPAGEALISSPTVGKIGANDRIYIGARDNKLWAVDADGSVPWRFKIKLDGDIYASPAINPLDNTIYMSCGCLSAGIVHALKPNPPTSEGEVRWNFQVGKSTRASSPALGADGTIYIGTTDGLLHALTPGPTAATRKWNASKVGTMNRNSSPAIGADGTVYIGTYTGLVAVNPANGAKLWTFLTEGRVDSSAAIAANTAANGTLYVGTSLKAFYAINPDGTQKWKVTGFDGPFLSSPAVGANGIIYVPAGKVVYALDPANGAKIWEFRTAGTIKWSSPAIGADKTLYVGSTDHNLYALVEN
jgi:outer membrane protein assembly factor BamB